MMPIERQARWTRTDLLVAVIALLFLIAARPALALAQSNLNPNTNPSQNTPAANSQTTGSLTNGTTAPGGSLNPSLINPSMTATPATSSQSTGTQAQGYAPPVVNPRLQPLPECRIEDTACLEQRNRLNQENPQTAPTFNR